jgi:hypothetical protein
MIGRWMLYTAALGMMTATQLRAQVTPISPPTIVPIVELQTNLGPTATPLIQKNITLSQGQMVHIFGRLEFTGNVGTTHGGAGGIDYVGVWLECLDPNGKLAPRAQDIGQNFLGPNQSPGPSYPTTGHMVLYPSTLITATVPGTYSCRLLAASDKPSWVVGRDYQGDNTTWLGLSAPIGPNDAFSWGSFSPGCFWQGPYTANGCFYLGTGPGSHGAPSVDVFSSAVVLPTASPGPWSPAPGAAFIDLSALVQVTLCGKTSSCVAQFQSNDTTSVVVDSYLELDQLDATGKPFRTTVSPTQRSTIGNLTHHDMIFHKLLTVPVYPSSNRPQFQVKLLVTWVSGSTAKIDAAQAVAFTSFRGHTKFVPNVVGLTESAATNTLTAAGYSVGLTSPPSSIPALAKVISQEPPGETVIKLPGSVVNLTFGGVGPGPHP